ncbi:AraC family transcriptional regulator [Marinobacterium jannaschii]|uniref:AraC family transcriptional regulator n=1 Tax=Marinobacterium jannaschii TaxID=64970 RepID=UPI0004818360|nr:response regulator transcription factor [Marinobacterium jannaschii]
MEDPLLLWIDLRSSPDSDTLISYYRENFRISYHGNNVSALDLLELTPQPAAICFDFDYPDQQGLNLLRQMRLTYPAIPLLMMSMQHSEPLVLWALRVRVWDFVFKPVPALLAQKQCQALQQQTRSTSHWEESCLIEGNAPRLPDEVRYYSESSEMRELHPAVSHMQQHYGEKISEEAVAALCGMRTFRFSRTFKKAFGVTFQEHLQKIRLDEAKRLLKTPNISILEIALTVGFHDQSYFARVFKKRIGLTPKQYREQHLSQLTQKLDIQS